MKEYKNKDIIVYWRPEICAHPGTCLRTLPAVFNADRRPWVEINAAEPEEIVRCIDKCPSGALQYSIPEGSRLDPALAKGPGSVDNMKGVTETVKIKVGTNCPYIVEGPTKIVSLNGTTIYEGSRIVLCTCGRSKNPPFCDGEHRNKH